MVDLKKVKSAEVVDKPEEIDKLIKHAHEMASKNTAGAKSHTKIKSGDSDRQVLVKQGGILQVEKSIIPDVDQLKTMAKSLGVKWDDAYSGRIKRFWASDERVDRHGDIVEQSWKFEHFKLNSLLLFGHEWESLPIGSVLQWSVDKRKDGDYNGDALNLLCLYAKAEDNAWADTVFRMVDSGFLKAGSVGFYPGEIVNIKDEKERAELGLGPWGYILRKNELIEWSNCTVPAHPHALVQLNGMQKSGKLKSGDIQVLRELNRIAFMNEGKGKSSFRSSDDQLRAFWKSLFPTVSVKEGNIDEPILLQEIDEKQTQKNDGDAELRSLIKRMGDQQDEMLQVLNDIREGIEQRGSDKPPEIDPRQNSQALSLITALNSGGK